MHATRGICRGLLIAAVAALAGATVPARAQTGGFDLQRNVEYGKHDGVSLLGDLYTPSAPGKYPAVVAVHGAGWQGGSKSSYQYGDHGSPSAATWCFPSTIASRRPAGKCIRNR